MRKHNRSCSALVTAKSRYHFDKNLYQNAEIKTKNNKRGYSAEGYSLLTSALRPRLFGAAGIATLVVGACIIGGFTSSVDNASATVQATLTIPDTISVDVNPYENNGFAEGAAGQVEVSTNNQAGYTLSIKSKDGTELKNGDNTLRPITTSLTADEYRNGSNGDNYFNTWGFKPDVLNNEVNTSFIPSPSTNGIVLASTHTNSKLPETFNLAIATKVDKSMAAGNYTNSFVLTATGNEAQYNIAFDVGEGSGGPEEVQHGYIGDDLEVQINSAIPTLEGKDFLGWCTKKPKEDGSCTGVVVQPAGCFPLCKCDLDITLYAMWGTKAGGGSVGGEGILGADCSRPNYDGPAKYYAGLCWMWEDYTNTNWQTAKTSCPSGWRLPSQNEFQSLIYNVGIAGQLYSAGWNGTYWSSSQRANDGSSAYVLVVNTNSASTNNTASANAHPLRCVAE